MRERTLLSRAREVLIIKVREALGASECLRRCIRRGAKLRAPDVKRRTFLDSLLLDAGSTTQSMREPESQANVWECSMIAPRAARDLFYYTLGLGKLM